MGGTEGVEQGPTMVGCSSSEELAVAMVSRVRLRRQEVMGAEITSQIEWRLAGEAGAELSTALPRNRGKGPRLSAEAKLRSGGMNAQSGLSSAWPRAKFLKEKLVKKTCPCAPGSRRSESVNIRGSWGGAGAC